MNIRTKTLFPTNLYYVDLYDQKENEKYKAELLRLSEIDKGQIRSNCGGWQSDTLLWQNPTFNSLLDKSISITQNIIKSISNKSPQLVVRSMWGNINSKGDFNFTHVHPSGWMSAVYYIDVPKNSASITFEDPRPAKIMDFQNSCIIEDNYADHTPEIGQLILFPSWLPHLVYPNKSEEKRISIAFNIELIV